MEKRLFSGDWFVKGDGTRYDGKIEWTHAFEGESTGGWSGGVNFKVTRAVAERLVEIMNAAGEGEPSASRLTMTRGALVCYEGCDDTFYVSEADADGLYEVPSWTWYALEDGDLERVAEVVDGTEPPVTFTITMTVPGAQAADQDDLRAAVLARLDGEAGYLDDGTPVTPTAVTVHL